MRDIEQDRQRIECIEAIGGQPGDLTWVMETMRFYMAEVERLRAEVERLTVRLRSLLISGCCAERGHAACLMEGCICECHQSAPEVCKICGGTLLPRDSNDPRGGHRYGCGV